MTKENNINELLEIMSRLRDKENGCPWDVEQNFKSIAPYTIEEAYEVAEAIDNGDMENLRDELGDLLFQTVFHAQMADEAGFFNFNDVVASVSAKMISRHPHVFGDADIADAEAQTEAWEEHKAKERASKELASKPQSAPTALYDVPLSLPALLRALKLQKRAARVGFDWDNIDDVIAKMHEEIAETAEEIAKKGKSNPKVEEEFGDLMFVMANLARHLHINPEEALRLANAKFERRFKAVEENLRDNGTSIEAASLHEMEAEWQEVKKAEKN
ncbi:MAG: nucleoside triphosphate pyrophosphohydrolase [Sphingomonadales bacterium]|nr:nucleoside triphosphate pyrophosphohydrolase [Sphingomonadales bacterium]